MNLLYKEYRNNRFFNYDTIKIIQIVQRYFPEASLISEFLGITNVRSFLKYTITSFSSRKIHKGFDFFQA